MSMTETRLPRPIQPVRLPEREELAEWAEQHQMHVPARGPVPQEVCDVYLGYRYRAQKRLITQGKA